MSFYRNPVLQRLPEYVAGKPIEELARKKGLARIVKLASNENALGPSPRALAAYADAARRIHLYPDNGCRTLAEKLAGMLGVDESRLIFGTGSDDIMHLSAWAYGRPGSRALVPQPGFLGYPIFAEGFGVHALPVELPDCEWDIGAFIKAAHENDVSLAFLASPNSPTGTGLTHEDVKQFLENTPETITVILDLAYAEFDPEPDKPRAVELVDAYPNLIVCGTFSKAYGLAGLRLGWGLASSERVADLKKLRTPFAANLPAIEAAMAALDDKEHLERSVELARRGVAWWTEQLRGLGLAVIPSRANFVMVRLGCPARPVFEAMLDRGVILRELSAFGVPDAMRITAGTEEENTIAFAALREVLKGSAQP